MLSVGEARERILSFFSPVEAQTVPLDRAGGRVLAVDVFASADLPFFDNSGVDGFALHASGISEASEANPKNLTVVADIPAGISADIRLAPGQAARIMTGAPIPKGADAVVMVEHTDFHDRAPGTPAPQKIAVHAAIQPGENIRRRGEDIRAGERVLSAGQRLRPQDLGLLAMLGVAIVQVRRLPRLALLSSGDELVAVDAPLAAGKVRDANAYTLTALAERAGTEVIRLGIAADQRAAVQSLLERAVAEKADLIVSSAGVSVGAFDFVKHVVEEQGGLDFWKVNMRPGKPLAFGQYRGIPFFGLPGNPVSAFIGFEVFVRPAVEKLSGVPAQPRPRQHVRLAEPLSSDGRETYLRAVLSEENGCLIARLTGHQGSGNLLSLVQANALLIVPSEVKSLPANAEVDAWLL